MSKKIKYRKKIKIWHQKERVILWDILPYEIPLFFSNDNFYKYLLNRKSVNEPAIIKEILNYDWYTIPFNFKISHKENDFRKLTVIHPSNQIEIIKFYNKFKDLIIYYSNISKFSIRKPFKIANVEFYNDSIHKETFKEICKKKILKSYKKGIFGNPKDYYAQNIVWFSLAFIFALTPPLP